MPPDRWRYGRQARHLVCLRCQPEENDVRTEEPSLTANTEDAARELLANIIGPFIPDEKGYCSAAIVVPHSLLRS